MKKEVWKWTSTKPPTISGINNQEELKLSNIQDKCRIHSDKRQKQEESKERKKKKRKGKKNKS